LKTVDGGNVVRGFRIPPLPFIRAGFQVYAADFVLAALRDVQR